MCAQFVFSIFIRFFTSLMLVPRIAPNLLVNLPNVCCLVKLITCLWGGVVVVFLFRFVFSLTPTSLEIFMSFVLAAAGFNQTLPTTGSQPVSSPLGLHVCRIQSVPFLKGNIMCVRSPVTRHADISAVKCKLRPLSGIKSMSSRTSGWVCLQMCLLGWEINCA